MRWRCRHSLRIGTSGERSSHFSALDQVYCWLFMKKAESYERQGTVKILECNCDGRLDQGLYHWWFITRKLRVNNTSVWRLWGMRPRCFTLRARRSVHNIVCRIPTKVKAQGLYWVRLSHYAVYAATSANWRNKVDYKGPPNFGSVI